VLESNNLTLVKADKSRAIVIIERDRLKGKVNNFIKEIHMNLLSKDPTEIYHKRIYQAIQKCNIIIDKQIHKHLLNIKPMAHNLTCISKRIKTTGQYQR
jgi:hypothetical protein